eukprot:PhM_4_TR2306/c0_g1_i1/m.103147
MSIFGVALALFSPQSGEAECTWYPPTTVTHETWCEAFPDYNVADLCFAEGAHAKATDEIYTLLKKKATAPTTRGAQWKRGTSTYLDVRGNHSRPSSCSSMDVSTASSASTSSSLTPLSSIKDEWCYGMAYFQRDENVAGGHRGNVVQRSVLVISSVPLYAFCRCLAPGYYGDNIAWDSPGFLERIYREATSVWLAQRPRTLGVSLVGTVLSHLPTPEMVIALLWRLLRRTGTIVFVADSAKVASECVLACSLMLQPFPVSHSELHPYVPYDKLVSELDMRCFSIVGCTNATLSYKAHRDVTVVDLRASATASMLGADYPARSYADFSRHLGTIMGPDGTGSEVHARLLFELSNKKLAHEVLLRSGARYKALTAAGCSAGTLLQWVCASSSPASCREAVGFEADEPPFDLDHATTGAPLPASGPPTPCATEWPSHINGLEHTHDRVAHCLATVVRTLAAADESFSLVVHDFIIDRFLGRLCGGVHVPGITECVNMISAVQRTSLITQFQERMRVAPIPVLAGGGADDCLVPADVVEQHLHDVSSLSQQLVAERASALGLIVATIGENRTNLRRASFTWRQHVKQFITHVSGIAEYAPYFLADEAVLHLEPCTMKRGTCLRDRDTIAYNGTVVVTTHYVVFWGYKTKLLGTARGIEVVPLHLLKDVSLVDDAPHTICLALDGLEVYLSKLPERFSLWTLVRALWRCEASLHQQMGLMGLEASVEASRPLPTGALIPISVPLTLFRGITEVVEEAWENERYDAKNKVWTSHSAWQNGIGSTILGSNGQGRRGSQGGVFDLPAVSDYYGEQPLTISDKMTPPPEGWVWASSWEMDTPWLYSDSWSLLGPTTTTSSAGASPCASPISSTGGGGGGGGGGSAYSPTSSSASPKRNPLCRRRRWVRRRVRVQDGGSKQNKQNQLNNEPEGLTKMERNETIG